MYIYVCSEPDCDNLDIASICSECISPKLDKREQGIKRFRSLRRRAGVDWTPEFDREYV